MCDHQAFNPSARGNMNLPFFQEHLQCGITYHDSSPSPPSWTAPEDWVQSAKYHENKASPPPSPRDMPCMQQPYLVTEADQHDLALALCIDECGECDDPTCSEPDCEADLIECTEASCSQTPAPGACHGNNTLCAGNLPPDVLDGAVSLAALRPTSSSYNHTYTSQPIDNYLPLCVAIAGGYYNPDHIHPHLPQCGPHIYPNNYNDQPIFNGGNHMISQSFGSTEGYSFGISSENCQFPGIYYDMGAQTFSQLHCQQQLTLTGNTSRSTVSPVPQQAFHFSQDSTPSTTSPFSSPLHGSSESTCVHAQTQSKSTTNSFHALPTCHWEISHNMTCGRTFEDSAQLQNHIQHAHTASLRKAHGFTCQWEGCPRRERGGGSFAQRSKLDRHVQSHTGYKASICTICGQQFSTSQSLVLHQRTHSGEKPHKCPFPGCDYAAAQASQLTMHNRTKHTKEKPLKCDYPNCTARFAESSNLSKHKKIHLPEAQCTCQVCFKSFARDDQLRRHMKTHARRHTGTEPSTSNFGGHFENVEGGEVEREAEER